MCDYSAEGVKNRKARVGDKLMASMLTEHTLGLVSPDQPDEAVCLDCGTRLIISNIPPNRQNDWRVGPTAPATFQQEDIELSGYRDGVVFDHRPDVQVLFQAFVLGMEVSVESIPGEQNNTTSAAIDTLKGAELAPERVLEDA